MESPGPFSGPAPVPSLLVLSQRLHSICCSSAPFSFCPPASAWGVVPAVRGVMHLVSSGYHKFKEQDCLWHIGGTIEKPHFVWVEWFAWEAHPAAAGFLSVLRFPSGTGDSSHKKCTLRDLWHTCFFQTGMKIHKWKKAQTAMKAGGCFPVGAGCPAFCCNTVCNTYCGFY